MSDAEDTMRQALEGHRYRFGHKGASPCAAYGNVVTDVLRERRKPARGGLDPSKLARLEHLHDTGLSMKRCAEVVGVPVMMAQPYLSRRRRQIFPALTTRTSAIHRDPDLTLDRVVDAVYAETELPLDAVLGLSLAKQLVRARHIVCFICHQGATYSLPEIGEHIGRDHTTVLYAVRRVKRCPQNFEPELSAVLERLGKD